jgi:hypothetical protein
MRGPDFMGHLAHASRHASYRVPRELDGQDRDKAVARMLETLSQHGTAELREDIERNAEEVRALLSESDDLETLAARMRTPEYGGRR